MLEHMDVKVSDADVFQMISEVDEDNSGAIGLHLTFLYAPWSAVKIDKNDFAISVLFGNDFFQLQTLNCHPPNCNGHCLI